MSDYTPINFDLNRVAFDWRPEICAPDPQQFTLNEFFLHNSDGVGAEERAEIRKALAEAGEYDSADGYTLRILKP